MRGYMRFFWLTCVMTTMCGGSVAVAQSSVAVMQNGIVYEIGMGAFAMDLPDVQYSLVMEDSFDTLEKQLNHDGNMNGIKLNASAAFPIIETAMGELYLGVSGFSARADGSHNTNCDGIDGSVRCGWQNPFGAQNKRGFGQSDNVSTRTDRDVRYNGAAVELTLRSGSIFSYVAGVDYRRLSQDLAIFMSEDQTPTNYSTYTENLDTKYVGAFVGVAGTVDLGNGFYVNGGGRIGAYLANANYNGQYEQTGTSIATETAGAMLESGSKRTYIGSSRGEIGLNLTGATISAFGEVEQIGWVPGMQYLDTTNNSTGFVDSTAITSHKSTNYTLGVRVKIYLN